MQEARGKNSKLIMVDEAAFIEESKADNLVDISDAEINKLDKMVTSQGIKPANFDELPVVNMSDSKELPMAKPKIESEPKMSKKELKDKVSEELGREVTEEELEQMAAQVGKRTFEHPKFPIQFKEMRGMLFHLFTKTLLENGEHQKKGIHYKGTYLSLEQKKDSFGNIHTYYVFTNKKRKIKFSIKNSIDYDFDFIQGGDRQLRRLVNSSFLPHFNKIIEEEKAKAKLKEIKDKKEKLTDSEQIEAEIADSDNFVSDEDIKNPKIVKMSDIRKEGDVFKVEVPDGMSRDEATKVVKKAAKKATKKTK